MKVLIIGESCKDVFVYGEVNRLSPEAPIPILIPKNTTINFGMAMNVMNNFISMSKNEFHEVECLHQNKEIVKTRFVEDKSNYPFLRIDEGEDNLDRISFTNELVSKITNSDAVIVSDYNKGFLYLDDLAKISQLSKFCILDSKKKLTYDIIMGFDFVKLNESEFANNFTEDENLLEKIIITLGAKGAKYKNIVYPTQSPKETIDVSGAGDTFVAAFTKKYLEVKDVSVAISFANKMSNIVVQKRGVVTI